MRGNPPAPLDDLISWFSNENQNFNHNNYITLSYTQIIFPVVDPERIKMKFAFVFTPLCSFSWVEYKCFLVVVNRSSFRYTTTSNFIIEKYCWNFKFDDAFFKSIIKKHFWNWSSLNFFYQFLCSSCYLTFSVCVESLLILQKLYLQ